MNRSLRRLLPPGAAITILVLVVLLQYHFDRAGFDRLRRSDKIRYELVDRGVHLLPSPQALKVIAGGFDAILSEFLMIESHNYMYQYHYKGRDPGYLERLYSGVTALDPWYFTAYRYGGYFLHGPFNTQTDALRSYKAGTISLSRPDLSLSSGWEVPDIINAGLDEFMPHELAVKLMHETGIHYFAYLKDQPRAVDVFQAAQGTFPKYKADLFETEMGLRSELRQYELVVERWEGFIQANRNDPRRIAMAENQIKRYGTLYQIDRLQQRLKKYPARNEAYPVHLPDFAHPAECLDRYGMVLMYEPKLGRLLAHDLLAEDVRIAQADMQSEVKKYHKKENRYPADIADLINKSVRYRTVPYFMSFAYNAATGSVGPPPGFGRDLPGLLYQLQASFYRYAQANGTWPGPEFTDPMDVAYETESLKAIAGLAALHQDLGNCRLRIVPGAPYFGLTAQGPDGRTFLLGCSGPLYARQGTDTLSAWPADLSDWETIAP
ncbi:hypothetical protein ACFL4W_00315 [Planctomycetota bacterium]